MKKIMFCLAVAGMFAFVACNNNKGTEENAECTTNEATETVEATAEETTCDSTATVETVATEETTSEVAAQ